MSSRVDHSEPIVFPPVIPVAGFLLGIALERVVPLAAAIPGPQRGALRGVGAAAFAVGLAGFVWMVVTMKRARTPIHNARASTRLVETGPFRFTRNPMYVFGSISYAGLALWFLQLWSLALLAVVVVTMHYGVVLREEAYLERRFGDEYHRYTARVGRYW